MLSWCFLWLVWLLYACGVRRIKGLWRICPIYAFICLSFCPCCPLVVLFLSSCWSCLFVLFLWVFVFSFSLADYVQKERAQRVLLLASSLVLLWAVYKSLNITVICCGSSLQYRLPSHMIPATSSGRFVGSSIICPSLLIVEYLQLLRQSEG